jgi:hypothetical protein
MGDARRMTSLSTRGERENCTRCVVEASFVSMVTLFLIDMWVRIHGPIV